MEGHNSQDFHSHKKVIGKNVLWLLSGQAVGRALRTAIIIYSARVLGVASWGAFSYALSLATFLTVLSDLGLNAILTREAAKNPAGRKEYLSTILFIKFFLLLAVGALFISFSKYFVSIEEAQVLIPIMAFVFIFDSLRDLGSAIARALEKMEIEGTNNIITNGLIAAFGFSFLYLQPTSLSISSAYALGTLGGLLSIAFHLRAEIMEVFSHFKLALVKKLIMAAAPFGLLGLMATIMINTDVFIIGWLRSVEEVGLYSAAQKIVQLLYVIPTLVAASFFPLFIRSAAQHEKFRENFETALVFIFMIAIPLTVGSVALAGPMINLFYGDEYAGAVPPFAVLALTLAAAFPSVLISNAILAHDKQKSLLGYAVAGIVGNIVLDLLFIPMWGIVGSAAATLINQVVINAYAWRLMKRVSYFSVFKKLHNIFIASVLMGAVSLGLEYLSVPVLINVAISAASYFGLLHLFKDQSLRALIKIRSAGD